MAEVAASVFPKQGNQVEVLVHVDENLDETQRRDLAGFLESTDGIESAEFCPLRFHLMLVQYNRERMNSQDVLVHVKSRNVHAELIGPM
jgi:hypothetical protein